jgi:hypothetical protein
MLELIVKAHVVHPLENLILSTAPCHRAVAPPAPQVNFTFLHWWSVPHRQPPRGTRFRSAA